MVPETIGQSDYADHSQYRGTIELQWRGGSFVDEEKKDIYIYLYFLSI